MEYQIKLYHNLKGQRREKSNSKIAARKKMRGKRSKQTVRKGKKKRIKKEGKDIMTQAGMYSGELNTETDCV